MTRATMAGGAFAVVALVLVAGAGFWTHFRYTDPDVAPREDPASASPATAESPASAGNSHSTEGYQGFIYGRVTTIMGNSYTGRLRWGPREEAFWGDYFNGTKSENPWLEQVPPGRRPGKRRRIQFLWFEIPNPHGGLELPRPFMARFGEIARIEVNGIHRVAVILKSGTAFNLDRFAAGDFDDTVRVWDGSGSVVDIDSLRIRSIEFLPTPSLGETPRRLHGTVHTKEGDFTGFLQWDREECEGSDTLDGDTAEGPHSLRFDTIRSISPRAPDGVLVTLLDGHEVELSGTNDVGRNNRGIYVDDRRYGRVLVPWDAFEGVDLTPAASGPAYSEFPPGNPITGSLITRDGRRFSGRLVFDLDESETTETLDAPSKGGVGYIIPFGLVASILVPGRDEGKLPSAKVTLRDGEALQLEREGDLGEVNAGLLIFVDGGQRPEYVPWTEVAQVDFDRPPAMYPAFGGS